MPCFINIVGGFKRLTDEAKPVTSRCALMFNAGHQPEVGPNGYGCDVHSCLDGFNELGLLAMVYAEGGCYCGKVKFKAALPAFWAGHCHCTQCQRLHGAAFVTWVGFKTEAEVIDPEKQFKTFSTGNAEQGFCQNCGSMFYFRYTTAMQRGGEEWLEVTYFARANFLNDPGIEPDHNIFYESHAKWAEEVFSL